MPLRCFKLHYNICSNQIKMLESRTFSKSKTLLLRTHQLKINLIDVSKLKIWFALIQLIHWSVSVQVCTNWLVTHSHVPDCLKSSLLHSAIGLVASAGYSTGRLFRTAPVSCGTAYHSQWRPPSASDPERDDTCMEPARIYDLELVIGSWLNVCILHLGPWEVSGLTYYHTYIASLLRPWGKTVFRYLPRRHLR